MDKIQYYNNIVNYNSEKDTENFLVGMYLYYCKADLFYSLLKSLEEKYGEMTIIPSFNNKEEDTPTGRFEIVKVKFEKNNKSICEKLNKELSSFNARFIDAKLKYEYDGKQISILMEKFEEKQLRR